MAIHPPRTFFTSLADCLLWVSKLLIAVVLLTFVIMWLGRLVRGTPIATSAAQDLKLFAIIVCTSVIGGLAVFFFGWLGRVTISVEGLKGPRYSGFHQFTAWSDVDRVEPGSLNGWPCALVYPRGSGPPTYLMITGREKAKLIEGIKRAAKADNPLVEFYSRDGA